jgi:hypothetical protein
MAHILYARDDDELSTSTAAAAATESLSSSSSLTTAAAAEEEPDIVGFDARSNTLLDEKLDNLADQTQNICCTDCARGMPRWSLILWLVSCGLVNIVLIALTIYFATR